MDNQNIKNNKLNELVDTALDNLRGLVDANTVIGKAPVAPVITTEKKWQYIKIKWKQC